MASSETQPRNDFLDASDLAPTALQHVGGPFARIAAAFAEVAGPDLSRVVSPVSLKSGVLRVKCASASRAQTMTFMQQDLVERLNKAVPDARVMRIHATAGGNVLSEPEPTRVKPTLPPLDPATSARFESMVANIADPVLRAKVLAAATNSERLRRASR